MWQRMWVIAVLVALLAGLTTQFIWKMIYFPEPIIPVIIELAFIYALAISAIYLIYKGLSY